MSEYTGSFRPHRHTPQYRAPRIIIDASSRGDQDMDRTDTDTDYDDTDITYNSTLRQKTTESDQPNPSHTSSSPARSRSRSSRHGPRRHPTTRPAPSHSFNSRSSSYYKRYPGIGGETVSCAPRRHPMHAPYFANTTAHHYGGPQPVNAHASQHGPYLHPLPFTNTDSTDSLSANEYLPNDHGLENEPYTQPRHYPLHVPHDSRHIPSSSVKSEVEQLRRELMEFKLAQAARQARKEHIERKREERAKEEDAARKEEAAAREKEEAARKKENRKIYKKLKQEVECELRSQVEQEIQTKLERKYRRKKEARQWRSKPDAAHKALDIQVRDVLEHISARAKEQHLSEEAKKIERMEHMLSTIAEHLFQSRPQRGDHQGWSDGRGRNSFWSPQKRGLEVEPRVLGQGGPDIDMQNVEELVLDVLRRFQGWHENAPLSDQQQGPFWAEKLTNGTRQRPLWEVSHYISPRERASETAFRDTRSFSSQTLVDRPASTESSVIESASPHSKRLRKKIAKGLKAQKSYRPQQGRASHSRGREQYQISEDSPDTQTESEELYITPGGDRYSSTEDEKERVPSKRHRARERGKAPRNKPKKPTKKFATSADNRRRKYEKMAPYVQDASKEGSSQDDTSDDVSSEEDASGESDGESFLAGASSRYAFGPRKQRKVHSSVPPEAPTSPSAGM